MISKHYRLFTIFLLFHYLDDSQPGQEQCDNCFSEIKDELQALVAALVKYKNDTEGVLLAVQPALTLSYFKTVVRR